MLQSEIVLCSLISVVNPFNMAIFKQQLQTYSLISQAIQSYFIMYTGPGNKAIAKSSYIVIHVMPM